jgi:hypothetical protein
MDRFARAWGARIAVIAGALSLALLADPASGAAPCAQRVLDDWSDNGRVDRLYQLHCYQEAMDALPADIRDYTNATDVIGRAMTEALRARRVSGGFTDPDLPPAKNVAASGASSLPIVPVVGGALALALVLAGGVAYLARRRSA